VSRIQKQTAENIKDARLLRPSNSSGRFALSSRVDWCSACERRKLLIAARHVVLALKARCRAVEVLWACSIPLFLIEFVTAWSWYGHFSKSLFFSNLWLVVYRLAVLYRHLSVNVSLQGNTTAFWDWSQVFGDRTFLSTRLISNSISVETRTSSWVLQLESYIFRKTSAKFCRRQKAALLQRLVLEWAVLLFMKSSRIIILTLLR